MDIKQDALHYVAQLGAEQTITETELLSAFRGGEVATSLAPARKHLTITDILYGIGGAIVILGITVLIYQNWDTLTPLTRIGITLGGMLITYLSGVMFASYKKLDALSQAFFFISAVLGPIGLSVAFYEGGYDVGIAEVQSVIAGLLVALYLISFLVFRKTIFLVFTIIFGTWFYFAVTNALIAGRPIFDELKFYEYRALIAGLSYVLLGYTFSDSRRRSLTSWLYSAGILVALGSALALGGWKPNQNMFWEAVFPGLALGVIFLSLPLKSRAFLVFGSAYLMIYILKITAEYFSNTLGWPVALMIAGLALIGIGYATWHFNTKYLKTARSSAS